jgi:cell division protein FtsQ
MQSLSATPPRRDPAPSRAAYRMQRLWLTPLFRTLMRVGLPAFGIVFLIGIYLASDARRAELAGGFESMIDAFQQRPEFMVSLLSVEGASPGLSDSIREAMALKLPLSSFDIDLGAARQRIETLDAVAKADLRVRSGGVLEVKVTERVPVIVWRSAAGLALLDHDGRRVSMIQTRQDRADLPLVAGDGADLAAAEALELLAAAKPILPRLRGLVRMGERRWDLVLDRGQRILLPTEAPVKALERAIALDQAQKLLDRDVISIDLRIQDRPVLRLAPFALGELRRSRGIDTSESDL